jgi:hypothetical protein
MTRAMLTASIALTVCCVGGRCAAAQVGTEIGASASGISSFNLFDSGGSERGPSELQLDIATPLTREWSIEGLVSVARTATLFATEVGGEYGVLFKRYAAPERRASGFFSVGLLGLYDHTSSRFGTELSGTPPMLPLVGGGVRARLNSRLAVEVGAGGLFWEYLPIGLRFNTGIAIRVGDPP